MPEDQEPSLTPDPPVAEMPATEEVSSDNDSVFEKMSDDIAREKDAETEGEPEVEADTPSAEVTDQTQEAPAAAEKPEIDWKKEHAKLQTKYQSFLGATREYVEKPKFNAIKAAADTPAEDVTSAIPVVEEQPTTPNNLYDMTPTALKGMINDSVRDSHNRIQAEAKQQEVTQRFEAEVADSDTAFNKFVHDDEGKKIYNDAELKSAFDNVRDGYGIDHTKPGNYSLFTRLVVDQLQLVTMRKGLAGEVTSQQIDAIDKARNIALTKQPPGAATPSAKTKTANDEALAFIKSAAPKAKLSDLHGT